MKAGSGAAKLRRRWFSEHLDSHLSLGHQIVYLELEEQGQERPPIPMPGPGEGGCWQTLRPEFSSVPSCALQREGLRLQRVHCLLPSFLPVSCFMCGQRDRLCGWLLLPQWFAGGGAVGARQCLPGMDQWESGSRREPVCGMNEQTARPTSE